MASIRELTDSAALPTATTLPVAERVESPESLAPPQVVGTAASWTPIPLRRARPPVVIVGAGPYGLAAAAHLRAAGLDIRIFGEPMGFWHHHMPRGMLLRSPWAGSHIADPDRQLTLDHYLAAQRLDRPALLPLTQFVAYGQWFQREAVPDLDPRRVQLIERENPGFLVTLDDGEQIRASRVIVATGLATFADRPAPFTGLPAELVSHSSDHADLSHFAGQRVVVIGAGQAALESAALLGEAGATVEVIARGPAIRFLHQGSRWHGVLHSRANPLRGLLFPPGNIGPPIINWIIEHPDVFQRFSPTQQRRIAERGIRPAATGWLRPRLSDVTITVQRSVVSGRAVPRGVALLLDDESTREVDHILLATGFRVDVARLPWLSPTIASAVRGGRGYPRLGTGFESTVPGLHFLGAPAAEQFGPVMRFVAGTGYAGRALTRCLTADGPHAGRLVATVLPPGDRGRGAVWS